MEDAYNYVSSFVTNANSQSKLKRYSSKFLIDATVESFDWDNLVIEAVSHKDTSDGWYKFTFLVLYYLLQNGYYVGSHKEALYRLLPDLTLLFTEAYRYDKFFAIKDIESLIICKGSYQQKDVFQFMILPGCNEFIRKVMEELLKSPYDAFKRLLKWEFLLEFGNSLGNYAKTIAQIEQFNEYTLLHQVDYFKKTVKDETILSDRIAAVLDFYRFLSYNYPEKKLFYNSEIIPLSFLNSKSIRRALYEGYYITQLDPVETIEDHDKYCFILKGSYTDSTRMLDISWTLVDLSSLSEPYYRQCIVRFLQDRQKPIDEYTYYLNALSILQRAKQLPEYPFRSIKHLTVEDAVLLEKALSIGRDGLQIKANDVRIGKVRSFLKWCKNSGMLEFDEKFFKYFSAPRYNYYNGGTPISEDVAVKASAALEELGKSDYNYHLCYILYHLQILTELRVSELAKVKVNSFRETLKKGQYMLVIPRKGSEGEDRKIPLAPKALELFRHAIKYTEEVRNNCPDPLLKQHVFIYSMSKGTDYKYRVIKCHAYTRWIQRAADAYQIGKIDSRKVRAAHSTFVAKIVRKNKKSESIIPKLTGHASINTDERHYIGGELVDMLEAAYGVSMTEDYSALKQHVVDEKTIDMKGNVNLVDEGCGYCDNGICLYNCIPLCPVCRHFVTTIKHLPFFEKQIADLDQRISNAKNRHDIEDLMALKEVYVTYIGIINQTKEDGEYN